VQSTPGLDEIIEAFDGEVLDEPDA
jgi:hypothetical protein